MTEDGDVGVRVQADGTLTIHRGGQAMIEIDGPRANTLLGFNGADGDVILRDGSGADTVRIDGQSGNISLGGNGRDGEVMLRDTSGLETVWLGGQNGNAFFGGNSHDGWLVRDQNNIETGRLDGGSGDIVLANADVAEMYEADEALTPGTVVVLTDDGRVRSCEQAYNSRVAGVVTGAAATDQGFCSTPQPIRPHASVAILG